MSKFDDYVYACDNSLALWDKYLGVTDYGIYISELRKQRESRQARYEQEIKELFERRNGANSSATLRAILDDQIAELEAEKTKSLHITKSEYLKCRQEQEKALKLGGEAMRSLEVVKQKYDELLGEIQAMRKKVISERHDYHTHKLIEKGIEDGLIKLIDDYGFED